MEAIKTLKYAATAMADLFMPRVCLACGRPLGVRERHLCIYCMADLPLTYYWTRRRNPMADRFNERIKEGLEAENEKALEARPHERYAFAAALFTYSSDSGYKEIPQALKYDGNIPAGRFFAAMLGEKLSSADHFRDVDLVVPVPLHPLRRFKRGYNQAEIIGREVSAKLGASFCPSALKRPRYTKTQTKVGVMGKAKNVSGAFRASPFALQNKGHILLVDDVFTTGSTLYECYKELRKIFDGRISIASLAVVDR